MTAIGHAQLTAFYKKLEKEAQAGGYYLNPDVTFTLELAESLMINTIRYGYPACPCRLADANREKDRDIICPCDYRDADLNDHGACYCALYVSQEIADGKKHAAPIPERRPPNPADRNKPVVRPEQAGFEGLMKLPYPVWRCKVCGYLAARDNPPGKCPVCHADKDRFEVFISGGKVPPKIN